MVRVMSGFPLEMCMNGFSDSGVYGLHFTLLPRGARLGYIPKVMFMILRFISATYMMCLISSFSFLFFLSPLQLISLSNKAVLVLRNACAFIRCNGLTVIEHIPMVATLERLADLCT